jgi:hypothetical protein
MPKTPRALACLAASLTLLALPAIADDTRSAAESEGKAAPTTVCTKERPTGSRRMVKVCRTADQMAEEESGSERVINRTKHYGNAGFTPPGG